MKSDKGKFFKGFFAGMALMAVLALVICVGAMQWGWGSDADSVTSVENRRKLAYIEGMIDRYFLEDVDEEKLEEGMYTGLLAGLEDPYSRYYSAEEYASVTEETQGHYKGIGVVMQQGTDGLIHLVRVYEGAPGEKAGLLAGDILYKVDGEEITGLELNQVAKKIKNPESDITTVTVVREGEKDYLEFDITKEEVEVPVVSHEMLEDQVGYLAIYEFTSVTAEQYRTAYEDLKKQGMKRLVIDLRNNPGGLLDSVCEILESILPKGIIVYTEDKYGNRDERSGEGKTPIDIPLAVLVNENSASASEIFAGAIQDYKVGTIVGTTTYGKGVVQTVQELPDKSAVKLTISNYFTPSGNNIHGKGIVPDVKVKLDEALLKQDTVTRKEDNQLQRAIKIVQKMPVSSGE